MDKSEQHETVELRQKIEQLMAENQRLESRLKRYEFELSEGSSHIEGAGNGLFTRDFIPSGTIVAEYVGRRAFRIAIPATKRYVMWHRDRSGYPLFLKSDTYILWLVDEEHEFDEEYDEDAEQDWKNYSPVIEYGIDAEDDEQSLLSLVNSNDEPNLSMIVTHDRRVFAVAMEDILIGEELSWDYHPDRDKDFDLDPDHIEQDVDRYIMVERNGWVTLRDEAFPL
ncbi:MAG: SET domain-containing protein-lysine N-methyltransferase [Endozoicomonadaceae bacterium]|nr:SET domain-containing protein-lysine N-methyltransferase [Endozoicomonadaceae bacterium]